MWKFLWSPMSIVGISLVLERLFARWMTAQGLKHGKLTGRDDPRAVLVTRVLVFPLTLVVLALYAALALPDTVVLPGRAEEVQPQQLLEALRHAQHSLFDLYSLLAATLIYVGLAAMGIGWRFMALAMGASGGIAAAPRSPAPPPTPVQP